MSKRATRVICSLLILIFIAAAGYFGLFHLPRLLAVSEMPSDCTLVLEKDAQGLLRLSWPAAEKADSYLLQVSRPSYSDEVEEELLFECATAETGVTLPELPLTERLHLRISTQRAYWHPRGERLRLGDWPAEVWTSLDMPTATELSGVPDYEAKRFTISWSMTPGDRYDLYVSGSELPLKSLGEGLVTLSFGEGGDLPMPEHGAPLAFTLRGMRVQNGLKMLGSESEALYLTREDLLGRELNLSCEALGENRYALSWDETKGERYVVEQQDAYGEWHTLAELSQSDERRYETERLCPSRRYKFRVSAVGGQVFEGSQYAAAPQECPVFSDALPIYAPIWATEKLALYADATGDESIGAVQPAAMLCVLAEENGRFLVRTEQGEGYIDAARCLINLPDYLGELCAYDITNSYASLYMVHEYEIPSVTDTVVKGYERIRLAEDEYLVPYLYCAAQKLLTAARQALSDGYRLKIYDAYRPNCATRSIYDLTEEILNEPLPDEPFTDEKPDDLPEVDEDEDLTYLLVMTNNSWSLGNFLATSASFHNMGIALDLTLESTWDGAELKMQTRMHDLSCYSVVQRNNQNAQLLASYMKGAGFAGLSSEWWHFQDNDSRKAHGLQTFMWQGVTPEGWLCDDGGWRYRRADGSYIISTSAELGGVSYSFDDMGYAQPAPFGG